MDIYLKLFEILKYDSKVVVVAEAPKPTIFLFLFFERN